MDMPITVEICDSTATTADLDKVFDYFVSVDNQYSVFKPDSEISQYNQKKLSYDQLSSDLKSVLKLCEDTKNATHGYFDIQRPDGFLDPSGLVKGWAIYNAAHLINSWGFQNYFVDAGGDIQINGFNSQNKPWIIGIRNPQNRAENVKILACPPKCEAFGVATSGTYIRGQHIYNPLTQTIPKTDIVSLTVIGPNIYEADRFATAAFAMGDQGLAFISSLPNFEAYSINSQGIATYTQGFNRYVVTNK